MVAISRIVLSAAAAALATTVAAGAADYDPPIVVDEVDYAPDVPVEVGSGWYLRGDVSYSLNRPFIDSLVGAPATVRFSENTKPFSATIGMGYHVTDFFRLEANAGLLLSQTSELSYNDPAVAVAAASTSNRMWSGMIHGYADLGTVVGFTPYVGAGAGFVYATRDYRAQVAYAGGVPAPLDFRDRDRNFSFAWSVGGGVAYQVAPNWSVDLGYQYFNAPRAEYAEITGFDTYTVRRGLSLHQVKLGVRYDLW